MRTAQGITRRFWTQLIYCQKLSLILVPFASSLRVIGLRPRGLRELLALRGWTRANPICQVPGSSSAWLRDQDSLMGPVRVSVPLWGNSQYTARVAPKGDRGSPKPAGRSLKATSPMASRRSTRPAQAGPRAAPVRGRPLRCKKGRAGGSCEATRSPSGGEPAGADRRQGVG